MRLRLTLFLVLFGSTILNGQELTAELVSNFIFQISSIDCDRRLSGFMLAGRSGIYTSLHGIVGCKNIIAQNSVKTYSDLEILMIDIEHDIAILTSPEINLLTGGLPVDRTKINGGIPIRIWPYSFGIDVIMDNVVYIRRTNPLVKLRQIAEADTEVFNKLNRRNSPSLEINVLNVQGGIKPGASGAPITYKGKVIGMATGEIQSKPSTEFSFGIPIIDITPVRTNERTSRELSRIASLSRESLFLFENLEGELNVIDKAALQGELKPDNGIEENYSISVSFGQSKITMSLKEGEIAEPFKYINIVNLPLTLKVKRGEILVSCIFSNIEGKPVAQIIDNEWVINPNNYFQRNYDKNGLEVIDEDGLTRFQIDFRDIHDIRIGGVFADEENIYFILSPDKNGNQGLIATGLNYITKDKIRSMAKNVPYMFVYPSDRHFGERTK